MSVTTHKLRVECEPEINASIILNKSDTGLRTPHEFELAEGEYTLAITVPSGYFFKEWVRDGSFYSRSCEVTVALFEDTIMIARVVTQREYSVEATANITASLLGAIMLIVVMVLIISLVKELKW